MKSKCIKKCTRDYLGPHEVLRPLPLSGYVETHPDRGRGTGPLPLSRQSTYLLTYRIDAYKAPLLIKPPPIQNSNKPPLFCLKMHVFRVKMGKILVFCQIIVTKPGKT